MKKSTPALVVFMLTCVLTGCYEQQSAPKNTVTGRACLGKDNDTLVEGLKGLCQAGDTIATKHPAYFCDFSYAVAYNNYNSAICVFTGRESDERIRLIEKDLADKAKDATQASPEVK